MTQEANHHIKITCKTIKTWMNQFHQVPCFWMNIVRVIIKIVLKSIRDSEMKCLELETEGVVVRKYWMEEPNWIELYWSSLWIGTTAGRKEAVPNSPPASHRNWVVTGTRIWRRHSNLSAATKFSYPKEAILNKITKTSSTSSNNQIRSLY
jgi:hypothetical protein